MPMNATYMTMDGEIVSETRNGVESNYLPDSLGSTVALLSLTGTITDTFTYWPYGETLLHTRSSVSPYQFVGTKGYYTDVVNSSIYDRARILITPTPRWQSLDPLWPGQLPYSYANGNPTTLIDATGNQALDPREIILWGGIGLTEDWNPVGWCITAIVCGAIVYELCQTPTQPITIPWPSSGPSGGPPGRPRPKDEPAPISKRKRRRNKPAPIDQCREHFWGCVLGPPRPGAPPWEAVCVQCEARCRNEGGWPTDSNCSYWNW